MIQNRDQWLVIGISGVTCGGKTTLANQLLNAFSPVHLFSQDNYFYPDDSDKHKKCPGIDHNDYDILSSLDMERHYSDVISTMNGANKAHATAADSSPGRFELPGRKILIAEGFTTLNYAPLLKLCDLRYYIVLEYGECYLRRVHRLYEPPDVPGYFEQVVWPHHLAYRREIEKNNTVKLIDGTNPENFHIVLDDLKKLGARRIP